jgi:predicted TIM-barrel fold metal-dependent hydrolase
MRQELKDLVSVMISEKKPNLASPAADCHFHIVDPLRFPLAEGMGYQPRAEEIGTFKDFTACMESHGISHGWAVQPSGYGYNNAALLDSVRQSNGRLKGIAVVPPGIGEDRLHELKDAGVVGVRFNLVDFDPTGLAKNGANNLLEVIRELGWFAEIQCRAADFIKIESPLRRARVRVLIDHMGRPEPQLGTNQIGFKKILAMADTGRAMVKLSGAFRESRQTYPFSELDPFAKAVLKAFTPKNCIWGSDWPFLNIEPKPDYRQTLACLERWLADEDQRRKVLWETPARLFDFK